MVKKKMPIGIDDFKKARDDYYVVDKTRFIADLIDNHAEVMLFTRPRRFGKTLTMSMLEYFFSIDKKEEGARLFAGTHIAKAGAQYMAEQGKYPVIFMTLKGIQNNSWSQLYGAFTFFIQKEFIKHDYLLDSTILKPVEKKFYERIMDGTAQPFEYQASLLQLTEFLSRYFHQNPIVLIDEYDAPIQAAYQHGFYDEGINFFKGWFNNTLKNNPYLSFAVLTGVLRVAKESIFSGLNNLDVFSVLRDEYGDVFGFTGEEVATIGEDLGNKTKLAEIKTWYDGYVFGHHEIYNPWSVISYFASDCTVGPYWINTSDNSILQQLLTHVDEAQLKSLQALLQGKSVFTGINDNVAYRVIDTDKSSLYTMLLTAGYLTIEKVIDKADSLYALRIPNEEIKRVYRMEILDTLVHGIHRMDFEDLFLYLLSGQVEDFTAQLKRIMTQFASVYDTAKGESFYHGFMLGMTALFLHKDYVVESNRESGYGRFDVAVFPRNTMKAGVIMEFKIAATVEQLETKATEALTQIEARQYSAEFQKRQIQTVWQYGIAFCGKQVAVCGTIRSR